MAAFLFNTSYDEGHQHFCLVDDQLQGITSAKKNHQHVIQVVSEPILMNNGKPVLDIQTQQPKMDHKVVAMPIEEGGHSHIVQKRFTYQKKKETIKTDDDYIRLALAYYQESSDWEEMYFAPKARICERYRCMDQWDPEVLRSLSPDRAALVVPIMNARLDILKGYQRQNSTDAKIIPNEDGDITKAAIYDQVIKHILESNEYREEEGLAFDDATDLGRGIITVKIDRTRDVRGEFLIEHFEWDHVRIGPHNKKNASDAEHAEKTKWVALDLLKQQYPDKAEDLESGYANVSSAFHESTFATGGMKNDINDDTGVSLFSYRQDYDFSKKRQRVVECQYKEHRRIPVAFSLEEGLHSRLPDINRADLDEIRTIPGIETVEEVETQIRIVIHAGPVLLSNEISDLDEISIFPTYAKKYKNKVLGKIAEAIDMQNLVNRTHSYQADVQNMSLKNVTVYSGETFDDEEEELNFLENGSKPNAAIKVANMDEIPKTIERQAIDVGSQRLQQDSIQLLHEVTNINSAMAGQTSPYESNVAMLNKQRHGLMGNEYLFNNLAGMTKRMVRTIIRAIPKVYDAHRIKRILDNRHEQGKFLKLAEKPYDKFTEDDIMNLLEDLDVDKYDTSVTESPYSPTKRAYAKAQWFELKKYDGTNTIPLEFLIKLDDDIPEDQKRELFELLAQKAQGAQQGDIEKIKTQGQFNLAQEQMKQENKATSKVA